MNDQNPLDTIKELISRLTQNPYGIKSDREVFEGYVDDLKHGHFECEKRAREYAQRNGFSQQVLGEARTVGTEYLGYLNTLRAGHLQCKDRAIRFTEENGLDALTTGNAILDGELVIINRICHGEVQLEAMARKYVRDIHGRALEVALDKGKVRAEFYGLLNLIGMGFFLYEKEARKYLEQNRNVLSCYHNPSALLEEALEQGSESPKPFYDYRDYFKFLLMLDRLKSQMEVLENDQNE